MTAWRSPAGAATKYDVKFALEVHPGEIAFDYYSTKRLLELFADRPEFGLNFDPSHLLWQGIKPHLFLSDFRDRVYHVHMKDAAVTLDGRSGMDRIDGATEAAAFVKKVDFKPSDFKFDDAIAN